MRKHDKRLAGRFTALLAEKDVCVYCGDFAATRDHFVPVSVAAMLSSVQIAVKGKFLLPCCRSCNSIASNRLFASVGAKRRYIQERLKLKYQRLLSSPAWTEDQLAQLGFSLQSHMRQALSLKTLIEDRIKWRNINNREPAKLAAIRLTFAASGISTVQQNAVKKHIETENEKQLIPLKPKSSACVTHEVPKGYQYSLL